MLRLPPFRFVAPRSVDEAVALLAAQGSSARLVAGGTDLWPNLKRRHQKAETVVSLMAIPELRSIEANGEVALGGTALLDEVLRHPAVRIRYPALGRAVASISSPPLRNMGTIGGNVCVDTRCTYYNQTEEWRRSIDYCLKEAGTVCWVAPNSPTCWAHSASDSAPILCALKARAVLSGPAGERILRIEDLFRNDGIDYLGKRPEEILTAIRLPAESAAGRCGSAFWKLRRRGSIDFAVLSAAAAVWLDRDGTVSDARLYLGAVASRPLAVEEATRVLVGSRLDHETIAEAARLARKAATPMDNTDYLAQWRGVMVERYSEAALREAAGLPVAIAPPPHPPL